MEPVGLAIGVLGLAGLFNNVVDCFEYVHIGRSFGKNYQISLLKLDNARLRLSRWGEAVGLSGGIEDATSLQSTAISKSDISKAENVLGQILSLFGDTQKQSDRFKRNKSPEDPRLQVYNDATDLDPLTASLHQKMKELSIKRQNRTHLRTKVRWALYEERHFKDMVENIIILTNDLVELFPANQPQQERLSKIEVSEFSENFRVLEKAALGQDVVLVEALSTVLKPANKLLEFKNFAGSNVGAQFEKNLGTITQTFGH